MVFKLNLNNSVLIGIVLVGLQVLLIQTQEISYIKSATEDLFESFIAKKTGNFELSDDAKAKLTNLFTNLTATEGINLRESEKSVKLSLSGKKTYFESGRITPLVGGTPNSYNLNKYASVAIKATQVIKKLSYLNPSNNFPTSIVGIPIPEQFCPHAEILCCDPYYRFSMPSGECNNLGNTWWGKAETQFKRILPPAYDDGISSPRTMSSVPGASLPNARLLAIRLNKPNPLVCDYSQFLTFFAQAIAHDITLTASISNSDGSPKDCICDDPDPDCFEIPLPLNEKYIQDTKCIPMPRSSASINTFDCSLTAREQLNLVSHYLDVSQLYGSTAKLAKSLRAPSGGLLLESASISSGMPNLPLADSSLQCLQNAFQQCYYSGDYRNEESGYLSSLNTVFLREHNRVARILTGLNPLWNDERLYQETRKIVTGVYQHIIYNEFLPLLVGTKVSILYGLVSNPNKPGYYGKYDPDIMPSISVEFTTAAFRLHQLIATFSSKAAPNFYPYGTGDISNNLFNQTDYAFDSDGMIRGLLVNPSYCSSPSINDVLNNHLLGSSGLWGSLPALDVQRGRDHGLQPYNKYRELCGLGKAKTFADLTNIPAGIINRLSQLYASVDDIDLFEGGLAELPVPDGILGPTFSCIIAKQFADLKFGDRFWFENGDSKFTRFNLTQLAEIRKSSLARLLCDNVAGITSIQQYVLLMPNPSYNPYVSCSQISSVDISKWKFDSSLVQDVTALLATL